MKQKHLHRTLASHKVGCSTAHNVFSYPMPDERCIRSELVSCVLNLSILWFYCKGNVVVGCRTRSALFSVEESTIC